MQTFTIGQLARLATVPISTVRYYERAALLKPEAHIGANYRLYSQQSLERLQFIRSAQAGQALRRAIRELYVPALCFVMGYQEGMFHPASFEDSWPTIMAALLVLILLRFWAGNEEPIS